MTTKKSVVIGLSEKLMPRGGLYFDKNNRIPSWTNWGQVEVWPEDKEFVTMIITQSHESSRSRSDVWPFKKVTKPKYDEEYFSFFEKILGVPSPIKMTHPYGKWETVRGSDNNYIVCERPTGVESE